MLKLFKGPEFGDVRYDDIFEFFADYFVVCGTESVLLINGVPQNVCTKILDNVHPATKHLIMQGIQWPLMQGLIKSYTVLCDMHIYNATKLHNLTAEEYGELLVVKGIFQNCIITRFSNAWELYRFAKDFCSDEAVKRIYAKFEVFASRPPITTEAVMMMPENIFGAHELSPAEDYENSNFEHNDDENHQEKES